MVNRLLTLYTDRIRNLPIVILMPHSRCNCRCVMCDIWKANDRKQEISEEILARHVGTFQKLGVREVVFSGGEALMHSNLWRLCEMLKQQQIRLTLLSSGLLLGRHAEDIVRYIDEVIVSIDGSEKVHDQIRNVPQGFKKISEGVARLRQLRPDLKISARCVLQRLNYRDFANIVTSARDLTLDKVSFLAADVSTAAFNRDAPWDDARAGSIALSVEEAQELENILVASFSRFRDAYSTGFIAERPDKILRIAQYYKAIHGAAAFPPVRCNAPWVSAVIETDGSVLPCFFQKAYGNIHEQPLEEILNSEAAISFRKNLDMDSDAICQRCVCSLKLGVRALL